MTSGTIRRLILTLATGYLTIFGVRQIPYQFENEWLVLLPALIIVYSLTVWLEGLFFKDDSSDRKPVAPQEKTKVVLEKKGFGSD